MDQVSFDGTVGFTGELDLADAYDFESFVAAGAEQLRLLGSTDRLDVRRAAAVGELARTQLALTFQHAETGSTHPVPRPGCAGA